MQSTFDKILNFILPPIIIVVAFYLMATPFKEPLGKLWRWIRERLGGKEEEEDSVPLIYYE